MTRWVMIFGKLSSIIYLENSPAPSPICHIGPGLSPWQAGNATE